MLAMIKPGSIRWKIASWLLGFRAEEMIVKTRFQEESDQYHLKTYQRGCLKQIALLLEAERQGFFSHLK
jgi:hypothetical protein